MTARPIRVAILHQGFIPHYRVRLYELLNQLSPTTRYVVFHGAPASNSGWTAAEGPFAFPNRRVRNRELHLGKWLAIYQPVIREILAGEYDVVVLGHEVKFLSNTLLALLCRARGIPVLYWGLGYHLRENFAFTSKSKRWVDWLATRIKNALTRLADGYLVYTTGGAQQLAEVGFPPERTFVLRNTIDISAQCRIYDSLAGTDPAALREALGLRPDSVVLIFMGRLVDDKHVEVLIEAVTRINRQAGSQPPVEALIVGSGPMRDALERQASGDPAVKFLGPIFDDAVIAQYIKVAAAVVIPGRAGLAINHALAQGRPVITRQHRVQGPELEYISHDVNGLIIEGDVDTFVSILARFVASPDWQCQLSDGALRSRDGLRMESMAQQFDEAVRFVLARSATPAINATTAARSGAEVN
ncbi:MAG: glycosyltransferase family 4 protein [Acidobacteriaceae bacterium]